MNLWRHAAEELRDYFVPNDENHPAIRAYNLAAEDEKERTMKHEPLDDGEAVLPPRSEHSELGYESALHLMKTLCRTDGQRRAYIEDLLERNLITQSIGCSLVGWIVTNPSNL